MGRRKLENPRSELLRVRLTKDEKRMIEAIAAYHKASVSDVVRAAVMVVADSMLDEPKTIAKAAHIV